MALLFFLTCLVVLVLAFVVGPLCFLWAWSVFAVPILHLPAINFLQAFAAVMLLNIIGSAVRAARK